MGVTSRSCKEVEGMSVGERSVFALREIVRDLMGTLLSPQHVFTNILQLVKMKESRLLFWKYALGPVACISSEHSFPSIRRCADWLCEYVNDMETS